MCKKPIKLHFFNKTNFYLKKPYHIKPFTHYNPITTILDEVQLINIMVVHDVAKIIIPAPNQKIT